MEDNKIELEDEFQCDYEECNGEEELYTQEDIESEEVMGRISVEQEIERWELQNNPISTLSEGTSNSKFFKESIIYAETMGTAFQSLLGYGIDYSNAISMVNNMMISDQNIRQAEKQSVQIQSQQI